MLIIKVNDGNPDSDICILPEHLDRFYAALVDCKKWFDGTVKAFGKKNNKLFVVPSNVKPIIVSELIRNKWLMFEPCIITTENEIYIPGLRIHLSDKGTCIDIPVERLYGLVTVLTGFNIYMATSMLLNYVNMCTPGTNMISFASKNMEERSGSTTGVTGRKYNISRSFFDK